MTQQSPEHYWENRYGERDRIWSGHANAALVDEASELPPGRALDLGCGEGGDSVWLATRGWQVTGIDVSGTALDRARSNAAAAGVAERIEWRQADLVDWQPEAEYDLVSACFLHSPLPEFARVDVLRRAASAVAPGGHLLVVGHMEPPPWSKHRHDHDGDHHFLTPQQEREALGLDEDGWTTVTAEVRSRAATGPDGEAATLEDAVLVLRRR